MQRHSCFDRTADRLPYKFPQNGMFSRAREGYARLQSGGHAYLVRARSGGYPVRIAGIDIEFLKRRGFGLRCRHDGIHHGGRRQLTADKEHRVDGAVGHRLISGDPLICPVAFVDHGRVSRTPGICLHAARADRDDDKVAKSAPAS